MTSQVVFERLPTAAEYRELCTAVGWAESMNLAASEEALAGSRFGAVAVVGEQTVGMGRVVGDGAMFFYFVFGSASTPPLGAGGEARFSAVQ